MGKSERIHVRVDFVTKDTMMKACDELSMTLSNLILSSVFEYVNKKKLSQSLKRKILDEKKEYEFNLKSCKKTRQNKYRHQVYNAIDNVLLFSGRSLRQLGFINMRVVKSLIKDWNPVITCIPKKMKRELQEEIKFFKSLDNEENLKTLFENNKESIMTSTDSIFQKMRYLGSNVRLLAKHEVKKNERNKNVDDKI